MQEIHVVLAEARKPKPADETRLGFGSIFTDHMFLMDYESGRGWHDPRIVPFSDFALSPGRNGAPLRSGHLRGDEMLSPRRRRPPAFPSGG